MQEERKMILKMIEDGKISTEEGVQLLNALKDGGDAKNGEEAESASFENGPQSLSKQVDWNAGGAHRGTYKDTSLMRRFGDFFEDAVQKVKDFDLDFNFGSSVEVEHIFQHTDASVENMNISVENGDITFEAWDEPDVRVECKVKVYKVKDAQEARRFFLDEAIFSLHEGALQFRSPSKSMKVNTVVRIPRGKLQQVKLYAFNGKLTGETLSMQKFEGQTVNGRIQFEKIDAEDVHLETIHGSIAIEELRCHHAGGKTLNGSIDLSVACGEVDIETLNGSIHYTLTDARSAKGYFKTTTGSVTVHVPNSVKTEGQLKTYLGGIHCDLPNLTTIDEKKDFASKSMAFLSNRDVTPLLYIEAETRTGSINVSNQP
ncbi:DUF4097 family beta strand repeat-containing protein [Texcoconibacillus texcoconensis]|uniref:DUF4097 and DUF4098 domain-containing protein YvlB n=1 Tax=Texcoconibacillus texcoconensis TaxID=1095777 RepID=A0A840QPT8_9BACI|nr:DUF4097 domain-containing protein [Texcoconibacillus texcoconensis]MBB5173432.1 DUF4097 and DUF4098 domain-containing protein YvlB [Texcoconibacillus texcoconensis]